MLRLCSTENLFDLRRIDPRRQRSVAPRYASAPRTPVLWKTQVFVQDGAKAAKIHNKTAMQPTPLTDGKATSTGHQGTACLDLNGRSSEEHGTSLFPVHGAAHRSCLMIASSSLATAATILVVALKIADGNLERRACSRSMAISSPSARRSPSPSPAKSKSSVPAAMPSPRSARPTAKDLARHHRLLRHPTPSSAMAWSTSAPATPNILAIKVDGKGDVTNACRLDHEGAYAFATPCRRRAQQCPTAAPPVVLMRRRAAFMV